MMNYWGYGYGNMGLGILNGILSLAFWVLFIIFVFVLIRWLLRGGGEIKSWKDWKKLGGNPALDLLNERYIKGEIGREEYEQKKKDILS